MIHIGAAAVLSAWSMIPYHDTHVVGGYLVWFVGLLSGSGAPTDLYRTIEMLSQLKHGACACAMES